MIFWKKNIAALVAALLLASSIFGQNPVDATPPENVNGALYFNDNGKIARMNNWLWDKTNSRLLYNRALGAGTYNLDVNGDFGASGQAWLSGGLFLTSFPAASASSNLLATNSAGGVYKVTLGTNLTLSSGGVLDATGGGGSSFYQTVRDNGTARTQRGKLNFVNTTQLGFSVTDDSGNDESEVAVALLQNGASTGNVLAWNGTTWAPAAAGAAGAGGSPTQVQYNSGGTLTGDAGFTRDPSATTGDALLVQGNSVSSGNALEVVMNSTAATGNTQTAGLFTVSGANANSNQTTYAARFLNSHTGTGAINVGGFFNATGGTDNYSIALGPDATQWIYGLRRTSDAGGSDLRIQAGGAFAGGSNRSGGNLLYSSGISTGTGGSEHIWYTPSSGQGSGTADRNPTEKMRLSALGRLGLGTNSPSYLFHTVSSSINQIGVQYGASNYSQLLFGDATSNKWSFEVLGKSFSAQYQNIFGIYQYKDRAEATVNKYRMFIADDGDVGFGVDGESNVVSKVQVRGNGTTSSTSSLVVENSAGTDILTVRDDGAVLLRAGEFASSGLFSATSTATVASTTTETSILGSVNGTKTLPTNFFTAGKKVTVRVTGTIGSTASAPTLNVRLKFGSTTIAETGAQTIGTDIDGNRRFVAEFEVTCRTTGASGTLQAGGEFRYFESATAQKFWECAENLVSSFNTTTTHVVDVTATWNTNDANNTIAGTQAVLIIED